MTMMQQKPATNAFVGYNDLREYLALLESKHLLKRITAPVDPVHELGAITARSLERKGPALLFENITGYPGKSLVTNIISTTQQLAVAFNAEPEEEQIHERVVRRDDRTHSVGRRRERTVQGSDRHRRRHRHQHGADPGVARARRRPLSWAPRRVSSRAIR